MPAVQRAANWTLQYVLKPLAQIFLFVALSAALMSALAVLVGIVLRTPWHGIDILKTRPRIDLLQQVLTQLPHMVIDGVTIGFVYAVIALGYTMVYGVLKFINFAHSEIFMIGGVVGYEVMVRLQGVNQLTTLSPVVLVLFMLVCAMVICGLLAMIIERIAYKPLRHAPRLVPLISAIGVSFFLIDFMRAFQALNRNVFNMPYPTDQVRFFTQPVPLVGSLSTNMTTVIIIVSAVVMLIGLNYFVNATKLGKGIRAVSQDQATSSLMGINVNLMITLTFMIGGGLGGAAGVLFGLKTTNITPYVGFIPGLKAFTAAVLGGIGNITGAVLGGIMLGLLEAFFSSLLPYFPALGTGYSDIFAFAVLILVLLFRPTGLLGKRVDEKV
jgi:branched-chain amino acid transport system permease protein